VFDFILHIVSIAGIYALIAVGLNMQSGYAGLLNFGHIAFVGIGAYAVGLGIHFGISLAVTIPAGIVLATLLALLMAALGGKLAADYWGIATLAIAEIIRTIAFNEDELTGGPQGISGIVMPIETGNPRMDNLLFAAFILLALGLAAWISHRMASGRFGRSLRLMREQPQLASCLGYSLSSLKQRVMMISAALTALAGCLLAYYTGYVSPDYLVSSETFVIWSMVMIGGLGNIYGVVAGALAVQCLYSFIPFAKDIFQINSDIAGALRLGSVGVILLACLLGRPGGLLPERLRKIP
jgi:branched-chain amino acid transport system permease protein